MSVRSLRYVLPFIAAVAASCKETVVDPRVPTRPESAWTAGEALLFDDGIDVGALPLGDVAPTRDEAAESLIPQRIDAAEGVLLAKFIAVSTEPAGDKKRYRLELVPEGDAFHGKAPPDSPFAIKLGPEAPAYGTIRAQDSRLIGRKIVIFFHRYLSDDGEAVIHFHLSPPTKTVLEAIHVHKTRKQFD